MFGNSETLCLILCKMSIGEQNPLRLYFYGARRQLTVGPEKLVLFIQVTLFLSGEALDLQMINEGNPLSTENSC